jgi:hypothetical protein
MKDYTTKEEVVDALDGRVADKGNNRTLLLLLCRRAAPYASVSKCVRHIANTLKDTARSPA